MDSTRSSILVLDRKMIEDRDYWLNKLSGELEPSTPKPDHPRPGSTLTQTETVPISFSPVLCQKLDKLTGGDFFLLYTTLMAALKICLNRHTHNVSISVGSPGLKQHEEGGRSTNMLAIVDEVAGQLSFRQFLLNVRQTLLDAYARQDYPMERLLQDLGLKQVNNRNPLFDVSMLLQGLHDDQLEVKTDITLTFRKEPYSLTGQVVFNKDLFERETIECFVGHILSVLQAGLEDTSAKLAELPLVTAAEKQRLLVEWNATAAEYPREKCIHEFIEQRAIQTADAVAVVASSSILDISAAGAEAENQYLTYGELNRRANQLAHHLCKRGVGPETLVGLYVEPSLEMLIGILGILKAGGAYVPLDPAYPPERLEFVFADMAQTMRGARPNVLSQQRLTQELSWPQAQVIDLDTEWYRITDENSENPVSGVRADNLAYVIYTSGSTGRPKGVLVSHQNLVHSTLARVPYYGGPVIGHLLCSSIAFDSSVNCIFWTLCEGGAVVLPPGDLRKDFSFLARAIATHQVSHLSCVPSLYELMLTEPTELLRGLRCAIVAGEPCSRRLVEHHQATLPHVSLFNEYGPTEGSNWCIVYNCYFLGERTQVPIGRPIANMRVYLLDARLQPVPIGVIGELYIGGDGVTRGYLNQPEVTAQRFIPNPFASSPGDRLYRTGDLVRYLPDGNIEFLGRTDLQIKIRGFRVELEEIDALLKQHPAVREAATIAVPVAQMEGVEDKRLVSYVVLNSQYQGSEREEAEKQLLTAWQKFYEEMYSLEGGLSNADQDLTFNTIGWNSSYTGLPIPEAEIREGIEHIVSQVLAQNPSQVLEIGCGTGLLLQRIAPQCTRYWGTDGSALALRSLQTELTRQNLSQVKLFQKMADDFEGTESEAFDAVILNAVMQYAPSLNYLLRVLEKALGSVAPGGCIFLANVHSLPLLEAFHTSVELERAPADLSVAELQQRVHQAIAREKELFIDPAFVPALKQRWPRISRVEILPLRGRAHNELCKFRYTVILHLDHKTRSPQECEWLDWRSRGMTLADLRQILAEQEREALGVRVVPNARVVREIKILQILANFDQTKSVRELRRQLPEEQGVELEDVWDLGHELGYAVEVKWPGTWDSYEVVFYRKTNAGTKPNPGEATYFSEEAPALKPWPEYANEPVQGMLARELVPQLRSFLQKRLPDYMIPWTFVVLEAMPLTPSGKVDRKALPAPHLIDPEIESSYMAPRTSVEKMLADVWIQVLGIEQVGIYDNFFELGGHSLLLTRLASGVRKVFQVELPLRTFFDSPTVAEMTKAILVKQIEQTDKVEVEQLQAEIRQLTPDEVKTQLQKGR